MTVTEQLYPQATRELAEQRTALAPAPAEAFRAFSRAVFADGALPGKTKQLIAVAVALTVGFLLAGAIAAAAFLGRSYQTRRLASAPAPA